jgi:hypothetical protein
MQVLHDSAAPQVKEGLTDAAVARTTPLPVAEVGQPMLDGAALTQFRPSQRSHLTLAQFPEHPLIRRDRDASPMNARGTALSRWLAALTSEPVEALCACFLSDLLSRQLCNEEQTGGLWDRTGNAWLVFDVDGTREAARQRALPQTAERPIAQRRLRPVCAPGYLGRKRGEVVRTRTTVMQAHTHQWLGTFGNAGNGEYRAELRRAVTAISGYLKRQQFPPGRAILRLDGQYGTGSVLADLVDLAYVTRAKIIICSTATKCRDGCTYPQINT